jgi:O-antigen/teichoic acid export membrane protein
MRNGRRVEQPSELVYVPNPSWAPVLAGAGIAVVAIGLFAGIVYAVVGGVIALAALWGWIRSAGRDIGRLPREQRVNTAVLPAVPLRRGDSDS